MTPGACQDCGKPTGLPLARFCDACRWRHRGKPPKYVLDAAREKVLREGYRKDGKCRGRQIARAWGWPRWRVTRTAGKLGLAKRAQRRAWTPDEVAFLEAHTGSRHVVWISRQLKRSVASVANQIKDRSLSSRVTEGYTARSLADGLGVDSHKVVAWIERGWPKACRRNPGATGLAREPWLVEDDDLLEFVRAHREEIPLHRVDPTWFMDIVLPPRLLQADRGQGEASRA